MSLHTIATPLEEARAALVVLSTRPLLVVASPAMAVPLIAWLSRQAAYASAYTQPQQQEVALRSETLAFVRLVNRAAIRAERQKADPVDVANAAQEAL